MSASPLQENSLVRLATSKMLKTTLNLKGGILSELKTRFTPHDNLIVLFSLISVMMFSEYTFAQGYRNGNNNTVGAINFTDDEQNVLLGNNTEKIGTDGVLNSTLIGHEAKVDAGTGGGGAVRQEASAIGYQSEVCDDYTMVLGKHSGTNPTTVVIAACSATFAGAGDLEVVNDIWASGGSFWSASDKRLKNNLRVLENSMAIISSLNGYSYNFNSNADFKLPDNPQAGLLAQELIEVYPYAVKEGKSGYYGVDYSKVVLLLLQGIKEQQDSILTLKTELSDLRNDVEEIRKELGISSTTTPGSSSKNSELSGKLKQNAPNPFSEETVISYTVDGDFDRGTISILDFNRQQIRDFRVQGSMGEIRFNGSVYPSGIYFYGLFVDNELLDIKKMIIAK